MAVLRTQMGVSRYQSVSLPIENTVQSNYRVLVVDDDPGLRFMLEVKLDYEGYQVKTAKSGANALAVIEEWGMPHLAIVDIIMPEMNGLEFCQQVLSFSDLPVILLTSVDDENTVVDALVSFAEDYVTKPFRPRELLARVQRVLRRFDGQGYSFDPVTCVDEHLSVKLSQRHVIVAGEVVEMTPTETKLLHILMSHAGDVLTSEYLQERLWSQGAVVEGALRVNIHRIRQKIEPVPSQPRYLETVRGGGYRFIKPQSSRLS